MAAVLACGDGAVLSHRSAAALWDIRPTSRGRIDVTVPARCRRTRPGIDIHRPRTLTAEDCDRARAVPCTSVARTLVDLAEVIDRRQLERAVNRAEILNLLDHRALTSALERVDGRTSRKVLESVLADTDRHDTLTRSELEERFLALCRAGGLPQPRVNAWIALDRGEGLEVDFLWTSRRLIAETDGRAVHTTHGAFENDRRRDQRLAAVGYTVLRFTYEQVTHRPDEVQTTLRRLLAPSGPAPTPP